METSELGRQEAPAPGGEKGDRPFIEPQGYAAEPGTGPQGETCGTCRHLTRKSRQLTYLKCWLMRNRWRASPKTDVRYSSPACRCWDALPVGIMGEERDEANVHSGPDIKSKMYADPWDLAGKNLT